MITGSPDTATRSDRRNAWWPAAALLAILAFWTIRLVLEPGHGLFLDLVNLAFHEAGHLALAPFGSTLHVLGGTLGQIAVPLILAAYFLLSGPARSTTGAAACVWWAGENLVNVSVYMADARDLALPLVGGGDHDWNVLFYRFGLLGEDSVRAVAGVARGTGVLVMLFGLGWLTVMALALRAGDSGGAVAGKSAPAGVV